MSSQTHRAAMLHEPADVTPQWLEAALGRPVHSFERSDTVSAWGAHVRIVAQVEDAPAPLKLRVKLGSATVFGRSEVDRYLRDFIGLAAAGIAASLREAQAGLLVMLDAMQDDFSAADADTVREVFDSLPHALARRAQDPAGFSWVHGDLNTGNILAPRTGAGRVLLIDYQPFLDPPPQNGLAMSDLAHAMTLWWPEHARRTWAPALVQHWHARLESRGAGYASPERLREDWRLCAAQMLLVPASRCAEPGVVTEMRWLWQMHVRRALAALADAHACP